MYRSLLLTFAFLMSAADTALTNGRTQSTFSMSLIPINSMRPAPSDDLPVMDLIEPPDKVYDPKPGDLDFKTLRSLHGKHFDPRFMSAKQPLESLVNPNGTFEFSYKENKKGRLVPRGQIPREIKKLEVNFLPDGRKIRSNGNNRRLKKKIQQFLWAYTYCPVVYIWKDLGVRFWPRWIREGHCYRGYSCSIPAGMTCKPKRSVSKTILRWHCQDWEKAKYCAWIPIQYPIITECRCSC